uniref:VWA domain-containing protein n=1 Tax=Fervidobacterium thailandense TaxID=1008305 RepID=A0A7C4W0M1_9BACT
MSKILTTISTIVVVFLFLYGCSDIPRVPLTIPPDPTGTTKPNISGYSTHNISGVVDKGGFLVPITLHDFNKVRLTLPDVDNARAEDFRVFEDNKEQGFLLYKESTARKKIDIAVVIDVTGSMANSINGVKNSVIGFANALKSSGMDVRIAVVPFDDYVPSSDKKYDPRFLNLSGPETAKDYVGKLIASGGSDAPENPYDAIMFAARQISWRTGSQRHIILITDAPAHYSGDGSSVSTWKKETILPHLIGYFTVHGAFVPGWYNLGATNFFDARDPREVCQRTGGLIKYTDSYGNVDLNELGIAEYVTSSWIIVFESDSPAATHTIEVFFAKGTDKRYLKLENVAY